MSAIALSWVATIKVGSQTAKQLIQFYASHNFSRPGFEFKNETLASQLEVKIRAIQNAHKLLIKKGFLKKEERFGKDGSQLTSMYYLNIPQEFVDKFFGEGVLKTPPPCLKDTPRGVLKTPLNNNINNKQNKRESTARKKREPLSDSFFPNNAMSSMANDIAAKCNINSDELLYKFKQLMKSSGKVSADWNAEYGVFLSREKPAVVKSIQSVPYAPPVKEQKCVNKFWEPGNPDYDRLHGIRNDDGCARTDKANGSVRGKGVRKAEGYLF